jgi:hypothetical protein
VTNATRSKNMRLVFILLLFVVLLLTNWFYTPISWHIGDNLHAMKWLRKNLTIKLYEARIVGFYDYLEKMTNVLIFSAFENFFPNTGGIFFASARNHLYKAMNIRKIYLQ